MSRRVMVIVCLAVVLAVGLGAGLLGLMKEAPRARQPVKKDSSALYVALGDSVASGLGLATPTDTSGCGRTDEAYPNVLAASLNYRVIHLACTGATIEAGVLGPQIAAGEQVSQEALLFQQEPDLITLAIGANDVTWLSRLAQCLNNPCGSRDEKQEYQRFLRETFQPQFEQVLRRIDGHYGKEVELLVIEYYQVFPRPGTNCPDLAGLDDAALQWARELRAGLNQAIHDTVKETGIGAYTRVNFSGHELCSEEPWIQGLSDPAPYHANAAGQKAIAEQIAAKLR